MIRYHRSLNHKRCRPGIGCTCSNTFFFFFFFAFFAPFTGSKRGEEKKNVTTHPAPFEKSKFLGSGGSMVARLKLKGIDGRAPPGVEPAA
jgi:hypothetical protein